jgi:hypothetical protein
MRKDAPHTGGSRMKKILLENLDKLAATKPKGYREAVLAVASINDGFAEISDDDFYRLHPKALPTPTTLAKNLTKAVTKETVARFQGVSPLGTEEISKRLAICHSCEFFRAQDERCSKCGCFLKYKTAWRSQKCPIGKW